jgi:PKD repeat protein
MLRSTRKETSSKALVSNCAGVIAICILLLATTVIIPQGNLYNGLLPSAYAQQGEDEQEQERQEQDEEGAAAEEELPTAETISAELEEEEAPELPTAEIISNGTEGVAPATFEFEANITGGTEPYTISWDFDDDSEESNEQTVVHTFEEAGTYNVTLTATDSEDQTASDSMEIDIREDQSGGDDAEATEATTTEDQSGGDDAEATEATTTEEEGSNTGQALSERTGLPIADLPGISELPDLGMSGSDDTDPSPGSDDTDPSPGSNNDTDPSPGSDDTDPSPGSNNDTDASPQPDDGSQGGVDKFGVDEIYPTADNGPTWYIREQADPTTDGYFYYGMYRTTTVDYSGNGVWHVNAETGSQEHGIRMHVDSPNGKWVNTEITGYFRVLSGSDQITMIARHGPSYHDDGGCQAYGYYGMTAVDGEVFFKKKLYHFDGGYTERLAQIDALENLIDRWVGMKFVVYDLENGDVKLELWIDEGDMTNNWKKVTELVDDGSLEVEGGDDCDRQSNHIIKEGTRSSYRVDDSEFDFKKLSVREIEP